MQKFSHVFIKVTVGIALAVGLFSLGYYSAPSKEVMIPSSSDAAPASVSIMIDTGSAIKTITDIPYHEGMRVSELLQSLASTSAIKLSSKDYGGDLGLFIESINGVGTEDKNKWWQFWVNNTYSTVGVSSYVLRAGDTVVFKFTGNQQ